MGKEKFLKIKHSVFKIQDFEKEDIIIKGNEIINKKLSSIIKKIDDIEIDNYNVYNIELEQSNLKEYIDIFIKINLNNVEDIIKKGIILPNRENLFKFLNVYQYSNNFSITKNSKILTQKEIEEQEKELHIYPYHIISIGSHYYDLKSHKIYNNFKYQKSFIKGGILQVDCDINILEKLVLFKNNNLKKLFILNNNQLEIFNKVASKLGYSNILVINNIKLFENNLSNYNNIFVSYFHLKKYYTELLKEYISKSREINFLDSIENMISDFEISDQNKNNKFFQLQWDQMFINLECFSSKKMVDIIKCIKSNSNWFLYLNKSAIDENIKSIIRVITPSFKFTDNYSMIKENVIYYKSINELPFLKLNMKDNEMISIKNFIFKNRIFNFNKNIFLKDILLNYDKTTIEYQICDSTKEVFSMCSKYNNLNIFYYFLNPVYTNENKVNIEIKSLEDSINSLLQKEKIEEFKLKLAIHEKMNADIIYKIKKNLSEMYDAIEEFENKLFQIKNNSAEEDLNINDSEEEEEEEYVGDQQHESNIKLCPISHEKILPENSAITICNHEFNFIGLLESLFNDKRCPICRYEIDYKQIKAQFNFNMDYLIEKLNSTILNSSENKIIIVSRYENLIIYLKSKINIKSSTIHSLRNLERIKKFNLDENKKVLFINRKILTYQLGDIKSNHFIFCESIWDDELDQYFGISNYLNKDNLQIKIDIFVPNI